MSMIKKMATAGAVAVMGLGLGAASASAATIDGISGNPFSYTGTPNAVHSFTVAGVYTITCPIVEFKGVADGTMDTSFTPYYGANDPSVPVQAPPYDVGYNCEFFGFPAKVSQSGMWTITVGGPKGGGVYGGTITIPPSSTTTIDVPIAGCQVTVDGGLTGQVFADGSGGNVGEATNTGTSVELEAVATGVELSTVSSGCPFTTLDTAEYNTNGTVSIPGIKIVP